MRVIALFTILSALCLADEPNPQPSVGGNIIDSVRSSFLGLPHYENTFSPTELSETERFIIVEGFLDHISSSPTRAFLVVNYAYWMDKNTSLSQEQKIQRANEFSQKIEKAEEKARYSGEPYTTSDELKLGLELFEQIQFEDPDTDSKWGKAKWLWNKGIKVGSKIVQWTDKKLTARANRNADDERAESRGEGQMASRGYQAMVDNFGPVDRLTRMATDCQKGGCDTADHFLGYFGHGLSFYRSARENLENTTSHFRNDYIRDLRADQRAAILSGKMQNMFKDADEKRRAGERITHEKIDQLTEENRTLQQRVQELKNQAVVQAEATNKLRRRIIANNHEIQKLRAERNAADKRAEDNLRNAVAEIEDEITSRVSDYLTLFGDDQRMRLNKLQAGMDFLVARAQAEAEQASLANAKAEIDTLYQTHVNSINAIAGLAQLIIHNEKTLNAVKAMQTTSLAFVQLNHAIATYVHHFSSATLNGAVVAACSANIVGAFMSLTSLFGQNADAQILRQIQLLREELREVHRDLNKMRNEMHEQFRHLSREIDLNFTRTFERFDHVFSLLVDQRRSIDQVRSELRTVLLTTAQIQSELPRMESRLVDHLLMGLARNQREKYNKIFDWIETSSLTTSKDLVEAYSDAFTNFAETSRDKLTLHNGQCSKLSFREAHSCLPSSEMLPDAYLSQFALTAQRNPHPEVANFILPDEVIWRPWAALFTHLVLQTSKVVTGLPNKMEVRSELAKKLTLLENDLENQVLVRATVRTPQINARGETTFLSLSSLIDSHWEQFRKFQLALAADYSRSIYWTPDSESIAPESLPAVGSKELIGFPPSKLAKLVPPAVYQYRHAAKRTANPGLPRSFAWELEFGWSLKDKEERKSTLKRDFRFRYYYEPQWPFKEEKPTPIFGSHPKKEKPYIVMRGKWSTSAEVVEIWARPKVRLMGYLIKPRKDLPETPQTDESHYPPEKVLVVDRTFISATKNMAMRLFFPPEEIPENVRKRLLPKVKPDSKEDPRDDIQHFLDSERIYALDVTEALLTGNAAIKAFYGEAIIGHNWLDHSKTESLLPVIKAFEERVQTSWSDNMRILIRTAILEPRTIFSDHQTDLADTIQTLVGNERVIRAIVERFIPEISHRSSYASEVADLHSMNSLLLIEHPRKLLPPIPEPKEAREKAQEPPEEPGLRAPIALELALQELARDFIKEPERIKKLPDFESIRELISAAKGTLTSEGPTR